MFKKGDRVLCVEPGIYEGWGDLTKGKIYVVTSEETDECISVKGNLGEEVGPYATRFRPVVGLNRRKT